jgi:hypothetical protein
VDFRLLGPLEVSDGTSALAIASGKQRALLAVLLLNANRTVARDRIVDELWGDDVPDSAQKMVLVSSTVKGIVAGSGISFEERGEHELDGVPGTWRLFAAGI